MMFQWEQISIPWEPMGTPCDPHANIYTRWDPNGNPRFYNKTPWESMMYQWEQISIPWIPMGSDGNPWEPIGIPWETFL